jgi:hypothetical protein
METVIRADVPGILPPTYVAPTPVPALALFAMLGEPLPNTGSVLTGTVDTLPDAVLDPAEKSDLGGTHQLSISAHSYGVHLAACGADVSQAAWQRTEPPLRQ